LHESLPGGAKLSLGETMLLIILTSHRADCFALCVDCLERHTDLGQFERIFVMGNALEAAHRLSAQAFVARHANAELREFGPRGLKAAMRALDEVLARYPWRVVVKIDEDVFVMPGWLSGLRRAYLRNRGKGCGLVSALVPNSDLGQTALHDYLCAAWPEYARSTALHGRTSSHNPDYAVWLWRMILSGKLDPAVAVERGHVRPQRVAGYLNINCILLDPEFLALALPFAADYDESLINCVLQDTRTPFYGLLAPESLAHHYSFGNQQREVDAAVPLDAVRRRLLGPGRQCPAGIAA
jgi:hypothetical protein